jgi:nucleotide-binding universal stress UspA family protein
VIQKVLLATDGSPSALAAARWVADLAAVVPDLKVTVLHVHQPLAAYVAVAADGSAIIPDVPEDVALRRDAEPLLAATLEVLGHAPRQVETQVEVGAPADEIVAVAHAGKYDLIVVGRRGLNPLAHLLLGSVSERVVRLAKCPVVVVHG